MDVSADSASVQEWGCGALLDHVCGTADGTAVLLTAGAPGIDSVLDAMRQHLDSALLQSRGCGVLQRVSSVDRDACAAVGAAGGIDVVVSAMRRHAASPDVQERGCAALCSLADRSVDNNAAMCAAGGVDAVIAAMTRHADSAAVQRHGCDALRVLATNSANRKAIVAADGVALVVAAMRRHAEMSMAYYWHGFALENVGDGALYSLTRRSAVVSTSVLFAPLHWHGRLTSFPVRSAQWQFDGSLRRAWLRACDVVGRDMALAPVNGRTASHGVTLPCTTSEGDAAVTTTCSQVVWTALADRVRVSVVGDLSTRPRLCASVYGGIVAMFLRPSYK
jgi:hypothetical protein